MFHENVQKMFNWNVMVSGKSSLVNSPIKSPQGKLPPVNYHLGKSPSPPGKFSPGEFPPPGSGLGVGLGLGNLTRREFTGVGGNLPWGIWPGGNSPGGNLPGEFIRGDSLGGNWPGGNFPSTEFNVMIHCEINVKLVFHEYSESVSFP